MLLQQNHCIYLKQDLFLDLIIFNAVTISTVCNSVFLHLDWFPTKCRDPSLLYYVTQNWEKRMIQTFPKFIRTEVNATDGTGI